MKKVTYEFNHLLMGEDEMRYLSDNNDRFWNAISNIEAKHPKCLITMHGFLQMFFGRNIHLFYEFDCEDKEVLAKVHDVYKMHYRCAIVHIPLQFQDYIPVREGRYEYKGVE